MIEWKHLRLIGGFILTFWMPVIAKAQRSYAAQSVLASGNWLQVAVGKDGVYKLDVASIQQMGLNVSGQSSAQLRVYGNGAGMLPESNRVPVIDDLREIAIVVEDGGDGVLNGSDFILFYGEGPDRWKWDSVGQQWTFERNLYSRDSYYYLTIQPGAGKRIATLPNGSTASTVVTTFEEKYHYELDSVNLLSSGQSWYGEEFAQLPGRSTIHRFTLPFNDLVPGSTLRWQSALIARSVNQPSLFSLSINGQSATELSIAATSSSALDPFARSGQTQASWTVAGAQPVFEYQFQPGGPQSQGWLNYFDVFCNRPLTYRSGQPLIFGTSASAQPGLQARFEIASAPPTLRVWELEQPQQPKSIEGILTNSVFRFQQPHERYKPYIAFDPSQAPLPRRVGIVNSQNLHASPQADLIIITAPELRSAAVALADFHRQADGLKSVVATTTEIEHEFGGGRKDPAAFRNFVKMFYDRAGSDSTRRPRYLLLLGDASYDPLNRIRQNTLLVPTWQHPISLDPLATYNTDDFFGFLDDEDDINSGLRIQQLDIGIGRIPARTLEEAQNYLKKAQTYASPQSYGPWRNESLFVADDEDFNAHVDDAEIITQAAAGAFPLPAIDKVYLDAYEQKNAGNGNRYPDVNLQIQNEIQRGILLLNYSGHGSYQRLAEETILDQQMVDQWNNENRLPMVVTATCDFAPYDNPTVASIGENLLLRPKTGAIALMTTTRLVFAFSNRIMNRNFVEALWQGGGQLRIGDAVRLAKNKTYATSADVINNRKFTLLGDPALRWGMAPRDIALDSIWDLDAQRRVDTLVGLGRYRLEGSVRDSLGQLQPNFQGRVQVVVYDQPRIEKTRANDAQSFASNYAQDQAILFRGQVDVRNGRFQADCLLPADIATSPARATLRFYASSAQSHHAGFNRSTWVGGTPKASTDRVGPQVRAWMNDRSFVNGTLVGIQPTLIADFFDSSGIYTNRRADNRHLQAQLDQNPDALFPLYDYYESAPNQFQRGSLQFRLPELAPGLHTLTVRAWDVAGNPGETTIDFMVGESEALSLRRVLNYPNPFSTRTQFWFEHNRPNTRMTVTIQIFTVTGRLVKTIRQAIITPGNRSSEVEWDGRDEFGERLGRGAYFYDLKISTQEGERAQSTGKIFLL